MKISFIYISADLMQLFIFQSVYSLRNKSLTMKTENLLGALCPIILLVSCLSQPDNNNSSKKTVVDRVEKVANEIPDFFKSDEDKAQVLLLGIFHFKDAGLDAYKPKYHVNIMSEKKQEEVSELLSFLESYKPTQILVEVKTNNQSWLDSLYSEYLDGKYELAANEIFQLGFRLAKRMGHESLIAGDVSGREYDDYDVYKAELNQVIESEELEDRLSHNYSDQFKQYYTYLDSLKSILSLTEFLLLENSYSELIKKHGHYHVGTIGANDGNLYPKADQLTGWWYNRNLRIFSNIRKSIKGRDERAGHIPILRQAVEASPEMKLVELEDLVVRDLNR